MVAAVLFYLVYPPIFYLGVFVGIVYTIVYFTRAKCPSCGARGSLSFVGAEVVNRERAFGNVRRKEVTTKSRSDGDGRVRSYDETTTREERAPVVRTTTRYNYRCSKCGRMSSKDRVAQEEDFSRVEEPEKQTFRHRGDIFDTGSRSIF
jgi:hypothetical protein